MQIGAYQTQSVLRKIAYRNENSERRTQWTGEGSKFTRTWVDRSLVLIWLQRSVRQRLKYPVATGIGSGSQYGCAERTVPGTAIACPMIEFGPKACPSGSPTLDLCLQIQAAAPWHPGTHCVSQAVAQVEAAMPVGPSLGVLFRSDSVQCRIILPEAWQVGSCSRSHVRLRRGWAWLVRRQRLPLWSVSRTPSRPIS